MPTITADKIPDAETMGILYITSKITGWFLMQYSIPNHGHTVEKQWWPIIIIR